MNPTRWRCKYCGCVQRESRLLKAPNPFSPGEMMFGCPNCKAIDSFAEMCDAPGCKQDASCGFHTPVDYRRTCADHMREYERQRIGGA